VEAQRGAGIAVVETGHEDGSGDYKQKGDGGKNTVPDDEPFVASHVTETVPHT
jgi:hypothetical protein